MLLPKIYLIGNKLSEEQILAIQTALAITPLDVVAIAAPQDVELAKRFSENVTGLPRPIAILANFATPLSVVNEDGTIQEIHG